MRMVIDVIGSLFREVSMVPGFGDADPLVGVDLGHSLQEVDAGRAEVVVLSLYFVEFGEGGLGKVEFTLKLGRLDSSCQS